MQLYIYAKSGHNFGLDNVRRAAALCNMLKNSEPILCTADYRASTYAKATMDVQKGVGVDVIGNMPNVMERGDLLIYDDSNEASDTMQHHMKEFCSLLYKVGKDIPFDIIDEKYFDKNNDIKYERALFFSDDDYANWFFDLTQNSDKQDMPLLLGHYFFFKNEDKLEKKFSELLEDEEYEEVIKSTKYLLTSSIHTALESLASGNYPVYFKRYDKEQIKNYDLILKYDIPVIESQDLNEIVEKFESIISQYPQTKEIKPFDISNIKNEIEGILEKFKMLKPSLEYKF